MHARPGPHFEAPGIECWLVVVHLEKAGQTEKKSETDNDLSMAFAAPLAAAFAGKALVFFQKDSVSLFAVLYMCAQ